jgi:ferritin-like metal-binding protein YciE
MSTQSIAVETLVVEELQSLFAAETALEKMYSRLSVTPESKGTAGAFVRRLTELSARAERLEKMLDALDTDEDFQIGTPTC